MLILRLMLLFPMGGQNVQLQDRQVPPTALSCLCRIAPDITGPYRAEPLRGMDSLLITPVSQAQDSWREGMKDRIFRTM